MRAHYRTCSITTWMPSRRLCRFVSTSASRGADESAYPPPLPISALKPRSSSDQRSSKGPSPASSPALTPEELAKKLIAAAGPSQGYGGRRRQTLEDLDRETKTKALERQTTRAWRPGDVYAPHDLSPDEQKKWRIRKSGDKDAFDTLGLDPLAEWKNVSILGSFLTPTGRLMPRKQTGLRAVNQRKISKAVRRAVGMGIMPSVHKHPEILEAEERRRNERRFGLDGRRGIVRL